jgi:uncharacterized membrane protein
MIPFFYTLAAVATAMSVPRIEHHVLQAETARIAVGSALAFYSAVAGGMMALTGIVFAVAFVMVQFSAVAYSPRLVGEVAGSRRLFHTMGIFFATFTYAIFAMAWVDRDKSGSVPVISALIVGMLLVVSMLSFALLVQSLAGLRIDAVLAEIGAKGRAVIGAMFPKVGADDARTAPVPDLGPPVQTLRYGGVPRAVTRFDIPALVRLAQAGDAVIVADCAVGDTLVGTGDMFFVHGPRPLDEAALRAAVHTSHARTLEQDPAYAFRLLVDIAIRALSPAVNDPTTAVQALDQIEDLLRRLAGRELDAGRAHDAAGTLRFVFPTPSWDDYLSLAFDEIRQFGVTSVQVMRRMRAALNGIADIAPTPERRAAVQRYLDHLTAGVARSGFDETDRATALDEDPQGLGVSRRRAAAPQENAPS